MATVRGTKSLSAELRKLAAEVHTTTDDGTPITREAALANMLWKLALGWTEITRDENNTLVKKIHAPVAWALQYVYERMEGKAPMATVENESGMKASDKVRELAKDRINALTLSTLRAKPPAHKPKVKA